VSSAPTSVRTVGSTVITAPQGFSGPIRYAHKPPTPGTPEFGPHACLPSAEAQPNLGVLRSRGHPRRGDGEHTSGNRSVGWESPGNRRRPWPRIPAAGWRPGNLALATSGAPVGGVSVNSTQEQSAGFGYTAFVVDAYAGTIVGWECSLSKQTAFVERAIRQAAAATGRTPVVRRHDPPLRRRLAVHRGALRRDADAGRADPLDRLHRRCLRQRPRGDDDRALQDRMRPRRLTVPRRAAPHGELSGCAH